MLAHFFFLCLRDVEWDSFVCKRGTTFASIELSIQQLIIHIRNYFDLILLLFSFFVIIVPYAHEWRVDDVEGDFVLVERLVGCSTITCGD